MSSHIGMFRSGRLIVAAAAALALSLSACTALEAPTEAVPEVAAASLPTGIQGAVDFDRGYITLGTGPVIIESYFDLLCPYCEQFELTNAEQLSAMVDANEITLRLRPVSFLDRLSVGTRYSTRAANALLAVAVASPDSTLDYLQLLFENKPEENAVGLTDAELAALAIEASANEAEPVQIDQALEEQTYEAWAAATTSYATSDGGVSGLQTTSLKGVPLVLVNGYTYDGGLTDAAAFAAFVASH